MNPVHTAFRQRIRTILRQTRKRAIRTRASVEQAGLESYRAIGKLGFLAPHWPKALGGCDGSLEHVIIVAEELTRAKVPDAAFYLSICYAGKIIERFGSEVVRRKYLPLLARGETRCCILYTEAHAGSDLRGISTTAFANGKGYQLSGRKKFNVGSHQCRLAICAAKTPSPQGNPNDITLFLVDLQSPGVRVLPERDAVDPGFSTVELRNVRVPAQFVLGKYGDGWSVIKDTLPEERLGLEYLAKAQRWLTLAHKASLANLIPALPKWERRHRLCRAVSYATFVSRPRLLLELNELGAVLKFATGELARTVGLMVGQGLPMGPPFALSRYQQIQEILVDGSASTISAGASEVMLEVIAANLPFKPSSAVAPNLRMQSDAVFLTPNASSAERKDAQRFEGQARKAFDAIHRLSPSSERTELLKGLGHLICSRAGNHATGYEIALNLAGFSLDWDETDFPTAKRFRAFAMDSTRFSHLTFDRASDAFEFVVIVDLKVGRLQRIDLRHSKNVGHARALNKSILRTRVQSRKDQWVIRAPGTLQAQWDDYQRSEARYLLSYVYGLTCEAYARTLTRLESRVQFDVPMIKIPALRLKLAEIKVELLLYHLYLEGRECSLARKSREPAELRQLAIDLLDRTFPTLTQLNGAYAFSNEGRFRPLFLEQSRVRHYLGRAVVAEEGP